MKVLGYVTSRSFQGFTIPVPAQNTCLREYALSNNRVYVLPPLEHYFDNCYMQLFTALKSLKEDDILAMYSAAMLPLENEKLIYIFKELKERKSKMHFILEAKTITNLYEAKNILYSYLLKNIFSSMDQIDISSLRKLII